MRKNRRVVFVCKFLVALSAVAAFGSMAAEAGQVDTSQSRAYVKIGATGLGHEHGAEGRIKSGVLQLGAASDAGELVFDMASFVSETQASRTYVGLTGAIDRGTAEKVTANMLSPDVLDVRRFPTATFRVRSAQPARKPTEPDVKYFQLDGDFTLHGATRPLKIYARADEERGMVHLRGNFTIMQSQFGIKPYAKLLGAVGVADELKIWGDLWVRP
jgi:polyisoprenoid-binding protein YceI